jgi:cell division protein FtsW
MIGIMANAARHEPEAVAALRAGRDDRMNRVLRLPLPEPYMPSRTEALRDRLRSRPDTPRRPSRQDQPRRPSRQDQPPPKNNRKPAADNRRKPQPAERAARRSGHHGGGQRSAKSGRRARTLEGQRYG